MLFIDSREKAPIKTLVSSTVSPSCIQALACADFLLFDQDGHSLGIERKAGSDLTNSLTEKLKNGNKRLYDQIERMTADYTHRMLILEGDLNYDAGKHTVGSSLRNPGWNHGAVQMILWSMWFDGTYIVHTDNKYATADLLKHLHRRAEAGCVLPHALRVQTEELAA